MHFTYSRVVLELCTALSRPRCCLIAMARASSLGRSRCVWMAIRCTFDRFVSPFCRWIFHKRRSKLTGTHVQKSTWNKFYGGTNFSIVYDFLDRWTISWFFLCNPLPSNRPTVLKLFFFLLMFLPSKNKLWTHIRQTHTQTALETQATDSMEWVRRTNAILDIVGIMNER